MRYRLSSQIQHFIQVMFKDDKYYISLDIRDICNGFGISHKVSQEGNIVFEYKTKSGGTKKSPRFAITDEENQEMWIIKALSDMDRFHPYHRFIQYGIEMIFWSCGNILKETWKFIEQPLTWKNCKAYYAGVREECISYTQTMTEEYEKGYKK